MNRNRPVQISIPLALTILILSTLSCALPFTTPAEPTVDAFATAYAELTLQAASPEAHSPEFTPTLPPPSPTPEAASPTPAPVNRYRGFVALVNGRFTAFGFDGSRLGFDVDASSAEGVGAYNASIYRDGMAYTRFEDGTVTLLTSGGERRTLDFIRSRDPISAKLSPDGSRVAWAYQSWSGDTLATEAWVANSDGSGQRKIDEITAEANREQWLVFHIVDWLPDGRLLYATQPTGIGGYILYGAWNGMRLYDPASGAVTVLVRDEERLGLSLNSVSNDLRLAAISYGGLRVRSLATGVEVALPLSGDLSVCGDGRFSPSDGWLAYACGRNNPDDEAGQVLLAPVDGSTAPVSLYTDSLNAPHVLGWMDEDAILFQTYGRFDYSGEIWRVQRDGTRVTRLTEGIFIGFVP